MCDRLEPYKIGVLTVTTLGLAMLTVQHDLIFIVCVMWDPGDVLEKTLSDVFSVEECPFLSSYNHENSGVV